MGELKSSFYEVLEALAVLTRYQTPRSTSSSSPTKVAAEEDFRLSYESPVLTSAIVLCRDHSETVNALGCTELQRRRKSLNLRPLRGRITPLSTSLSPLYGTGMEYNLLTKLIWLSTTTLPTGYSA
jgi:hypothetical protein